MSDKLSETPKRLWLDPQESGFANWYARRDQLNNFDVEYVRADEARCERLERVIGEWVAAHTDEQYAHCNTRYCVTSDALREALKEEA
jgi:hypothetical protein